MTPHQEKQIEVWAQYLEENPDDHDIDADFDPAMWHCKIHRGMAMLEAELWRLQGMEAELRRDLTGSFLKGALILREAEIADTEAMLERWASYLRILEQP